MRVALLLALSGCRAIFSIDSPVLSDAVTPRDDTMRMIDGAIDAAPNCYGTGPFMICLAHAPTVASLTINNNQSTDTSQYCALADDYSWPNSTAQPDACLVYAQNVIVNGTSSRWVGSRPLVILGTNSVAIYAALDVASHRTDGNPGAGQTPLKCNAGTLPGNMPSGCGGGGAGGTFMSLGGAGGVGEAPTGTQGTPGAVASVPNVLRSGCAGQTGGNGAQGAGGAGGKGGGAVYVLSGATLQIMGRINASGAGADSAAKEGGGGGGGAGGMIVLYASTLSVTGTVVANGGGGSSGGTNGASGQGGDDPDPASPTIPAAPGMTGGADGGAGFAGLSLAVGGNAGDASSGGGGGGGGAGLILTNAAIAGTSPAVTIGL